MRIYLAGPEVFLASARQVGERKKDLCGRYGHVGLFPLDNEVDDASEIFRGNLRLMDEADAVIANITPFRGPSADPGTVFEIGYMFRRGRPVFAYTNVAESYASRVRAFFGLGAQADSDADGLWIEDYGLTDNLMIDRAVAESGGRIVMQSCGPERLYTDLGGFEACLQALDGTAGRPGHAVSAQS